MKVLIADDHALFRDALGKLIESLDNSATVVQAANYLQTLKILTSEPHFDMVIVDLEMHDLPSWEQGIDELKKLSGNANLVVVSAVENPRNIRTKKKKRVYLITKFFFPFSERELVTFDVNCLLI